MPLTHGPAVAREPPDHPPPPPAPAPQGCTKARPQALLREVLLIGQQAGPSLAFKGRLCKHPLMPPASPPGEGDTHFTGSRCRDTAHSRGLALAASPRGSASASTTLHVRWAPRGTISLVESPPHGVFCSVKQ